MADTLGGLQLPVPTTDTPVGDPLLTTLLSYFQAVLNAKASAAWGALDPTKPCVRAVHANGPDIGTFVDRELPALFIERREIGKAVWIGQDFRVRPCTLVMSWVYPSVAQARQQGRDPFLNVIGAVLDHAIEFEGRDPAWVVGGDTDPLAATRGSLLWKYAAVHSLTVMKTRRFPLIIREAQPEQMHAGANGRVVGIYDRIEVTFSCEERLDVDPSVHYDAFAYVDVTTTNPGAPSPITTGGGRFT